ncbi:MAG: 4Fe-4S dicluster domain-containing protein [Desulfomonilia bacterium]
MEKDEKKLDSLLGKETSRRSFLKGAGATAGLVVTAGAVGGAKPSVAQAQEQKPILKYLFVERQNCTGCRACEYACSMFHEGVVRPAMARIHVLKYKGVVDVPVICHHCTDAPCIEACPTTPKAIQKDPKTNGIKLDPKICLGAKCMKCQDACPAEFIRQNPDTGQPLMCDLCDGDPECAKACAAQATNPLAPCIMAGVSGFGVNQAFRDVTPEEAAKDLLANLYYPNVDGGRR